MALIRCNECNKEVSNKAEFCPSCGNPINRRIVASEPIEVEFTSKKWKRKSTASTILLVMGIAAMLKSLEFGTAIVGVSLIMKMAARTGAWWTNG